MSKIRVYKPVWQLFYKS